MDHSTRARIAVSALLGAVTLTAAQTLPPDLIFRDCLKPPFKVAAVGRGVMPIRELIDATPEARAARSTVLSEAKRLADQNAVIGLLLLEKGGTVLFETYRRGAEQHSPMIGYSMSKSATSAAVGHALCDGIFKSIDDPAGRYSTDREGSAFGQASLRNLLNLAGGP